MVELWVGVFRLHSGKKKGCKKNQFQIESFETQPSGRGRFGAFKETEGVCKIKRSAKEKKEAKSWRKGLRLELGKDQREQQDYRTESRKKAMLAANSYGRFDFRDKLNADALHQSACQRTWQNNGLL